MNWMWHSRLHWDRPAPASSVVAAAAACRWRRSSTRASASSACRGGCGRRQWCRTAIDYNLDLNKCSNWSTAHTHIPVRWTPYSSPWPSASSSGCASVRHRWRTRRAATTGSTARHAADWGAPDWWTLSPHSCRSLVRKTLRPSRRRCSRPAASGWWRSWCGCCAWPTCWRTAAGAWAAGGHGPGGSGTFGEEEKKGNQR